ncbi:diguanylate cyclase [Desulfurobacterium thermolithotrophum DSM 11699]|uniref:diguanylate cyclase n=1 Tax=Desulfurobacterium thermolithotrophum (strain DSM 11699 / BSA) TaxID=868864 RepID=F0S385_DESTD|nr:diguanylate cyclase [Desulfurobacterium thermolithotrophum DSM 11699]
MESIKRFLIKRAIFAFILSGATIFFLSTVLINNFSCLYEKHLRYITALAGKNLYDTTQIYFNDLLIKQELKNIKSEISSSKAVYFRINAKNYFSSEEENYKQSFNLCKNITSEKIFYTTDGILVCYPIYEKFASQLITERKRVGIFALLFDENVLNDILFQWILQNIALFLIFLVFSGFLFFEMSIRIHKNFTILNKTIVFVENLLKEVEVLSNYKEKLRNYLKQVYFQEFKQVGVLIVELIDRVITLTENLRLQAIRDSLTGLYNRNYFNQFAEKVLGLIQRHKFPLSVAMIDIDDFKFINDNFGHQKGDEVLKTLGTIVLKSIRKSDLAVRFGGEEILLIFPNTDKRTASHVVDRIKKEFYKFDFGIGKSVTFSAGVANFPEDVKELQSLDELIKIADRRLYIAKRTGKNKIVIEG